MGKSLGEVQTKYMSHPETAICGQRLLSSGKGWCHLKTPKGLPEFLNRVTFEPGPQKLNCLSLSTGSLTVQS